jgi:tRNA1(Val) A37 N6-methylase TrmN6
MHNTYFAGGKNRGKIHNRPEIQSDMAEMANRSVLLNSLEESFKIVCGDIKGCVELSSFKFNVVCNQSALYECWKRACKSFRYQSIARHEIYALWRT